MMFLGITFYCHNLTSKHLQKNKMSKLVYEFQLIFLCIFQGCDLTNFCDLKNILLKTNFTYISKLRRYFQVKVLYFLVTKRIHQYIFLF